MSQVLKLLVLCGAMVVGLFGVDVAFAQESTVRKGVILEMVPVEKGKAASILSKRTLTAIGTMAGSKAGAAGGQATQAAGANIGMDAGEATNRALQATRHDLVIRLDDGEEVSFRLKADETRGLKKGDKVRIIGMGRSARVVADR